MRAVVNECLCVGIREPREYEFNGRKGVSYAVEITDGNGAVELPVSTKEVFESFVLLENFTVEIEFSMVAQATSNGNARMFPKCRIVGCERN